jgi:hypothetical protein
MRTVFLDTSVVRNANFAFSSAPFEVLRALAEHGVIEVLTSDITLAECESVLFEQIDRAIAALRKAKSEAQLFENLGDPLAREVVVPTMSEVTPRLTTLLRGYFAAKGFTVIPASTRAATEVFQRYFARQPPFGSGKKKSEFPDAFVLEALVDAAKARGGVIDVVSTDKDWAAAAAEEPSLKFHTSLSALLSDLQELPSARFARAMAAFRQLRKNLEGAVSEALMSEWVQLADSPGEVESVDVEAMEIEDPRILAITDEDVVTYECVVIATLRLEVNVPREESFMYDDEEKVGSYTDWSYVTVEREAAFTVGFKIDLNHPHPSRFGNTEIQLNYGRPIRVYMDEDAADNFK